LAGRWRKLPAAEVAAAYRHRRDDARRRPNRKRKPNSDGLPVARKVELPVQIVLPRPTGDRVASIGR
jgi:hypothetical protein